MSSDTDNDLRIKAYKLVARAEGDEEFAKRAKADPAAVLREAGIPENALAGGDAAGGQGQQMKRWCVDFTCWSSECPATCYATF